MVLPIAKSWLRIEECFKHLDTDDLEDSFFQRVFKLDKKAPLLSLEIHIFSSQKHVELLFLLSFRHPPKVKYNTNGDFFIKAFIINYQISLFVLNPLYFYKLCHNFCIKSFKYEVINRYMQNSM